MPSAFLCSVTARCHRNHGKAPYSPWDHGYQAYLEILSGPDAHFTDDRRHPKVDGIHHHDTKHVGNAKLPHAWVCECITHRMALNKMVIASDALVDGISDDRLLIL